MGFTYQGVAHNQTGYNGFTGASASWNEQKGMWVDTNGQEIRDDAITSTPGNGAQPSGDAGGGGSQPATSGGGSPLDALKGLNGGGSAAGGSDTPYNIGTPSSGNPLLGQGAPANRQIIIGLRSPRIY